MISIFFSQFFGKILPYLGGGAVYCVGYQKTRKLALIRGGLFNRGGLFGMNDTVVNFLRGRKIHEEIFSEECLLN